jgi:hypothetical protein
MRIFKVVSEGGDEFFVSCNKWPTLKKLKPLIMEQFGDDEEYFKEGVENDHYSIYDVKVIKIKE